MSLWWCRWFLEDSQNFWRKWFQYQVSKEVIDYKDFQSKIDFSDYWLKTIKNNFQQLSCQNIFCAWICKCLDWQNWTLNFKDCVIMFQSHQHTDLYQQLFISFLLMMLLVAEEGKPGWWSTAMVLRSMAMVGGWRVGRWDRMVTGMVTTWPRSPSGRSPECSQSMMRLSSTGDYPRSCCWECFLILMWCLSVDLLR